MKDIEPRSEPDAEPLFPPASDPADEIDLDPLAPLLESIVLPEREGADALVQSMWPEIPADDPSRLIPQAIERWSDPQPTRRWGMGVTLVAVMLAIMAAGGGLMWRRAVSGRSTRATVATATSTRTTTPPPVAPMPAMTPAPRVDVASAPDTPPRAAEALLPPELPPVPGLDQRRPMAELPPPPAPVARQPLAPTSPAVPAPVPPPTARAGAGAPQHGASSVAVGRAGAPSATVNPSRGAAPTAASPPTSAAIDSARAEVGAPTVVFEPTLPVIPRPVSPPSVAPAAATGIPAVTDELRVRALLDRYRAAFASLDVDQARAVWPKVDARGLARAFGQLASQQFDFAACEVVVTGDRASAGCSGNAEYVTKVGSKAPRVDAREWTFELRRLDQQWRIESVVTR